MNVSRRHFLFGSLALPAFAAEQAGRRKAQCPADPGGRSARLDAGLLRQPEVRTPNIDRLAQTGTRFLNHYACAPLPDRLAPHCSAGCTTMQLKATGEVTLEKLLGGIGYACGATTGGAEAAKFLEAQTAAKPFLLTASFAPYTTLPDPGAYAKAPLDTFAQEAPAKNAARQGDAGSDPVWAICEG